MRKSLEFARYVAQVLLQLLLLLLLLAESSLTAENVSFCASVWLGIQDRGLLLFACWYSTLPYIVIQRPPAVAVVQLAQQKRKQKYRGPRRRRNNVENICCKCMKAGCLLAVLNRLKVVIARKGWRFQTHPPNYPLLNYKVGGVPDFLPTHQPTHPGLKIHPEPQGE